MSDMEELFKKAVKERKKQKAEKAKGGNNSSYPQYERVHYTALETGNFSQIRFLGEPISVRSESTSPKIIYSSSILGDDDKNFRCIFPSKQEEPNWILWKVIKKVLAYDWDPDAGQNGEKVFKHKNSHPTVFNRVAKNNKSHNLETGWYPTSYVIHNVIDRDPKFYSWHRENKKTLLLSKKASKMQNGDFFYEPGYPPTLYNTIMEEIIEVNGEPNMYDIIVEKIDSMPYYRVYHPSEDYNKILTRFDKDLDSLKQSLPGFNKDVVEGPLTDEELSWERYDIDLHFSVTSYRKIQNRLGEFIEKVDKSFGTKYKQELDELVEEETKQWEKEGKLVDTKGKAKEKETEDSTPTPDSNENPAPKRRRNAEENSKEDFSVEKILHDHDELKGREYLTPENKAIIKGVEYNEDGTIKTFKYDEDELVFVCINEDKGCTMTSPDNFTHCPLCGESFD